MTIQSDDLIEQFGAKTIHHAHHDNECSDAKHHGNQADRGNEKDEPLALSRQQVAAGDHTFVGRQDHAARALRALAQAGNMCGLLRNEHRWHQIGGASP